VIDLAGEIHQQADEPQNPDVARHWRTHIH
jgi:hypothetical protein